MPSKIEAIEKMKSPESMQDIQIFLGMIGYYCRFVPNFASIAEPLTVLLRKDKPFQWEQDQVKAFDDLRKILTSELLLLYPNFDKEFILQTNASIIAIGAVLSQIGDDGYEHPVAYCSRVLNKHEQNYSVTERECLAVIYAVKQFRVYVHGVHFQVVTNHSLLKWLQSLKEPE